MIQTLLHGTQYNGKYVAMKSVNDTTVVGDGRTPQEAYEMAVKKGYPNPVMTFIPTKGMVQIY